MEIQHLRTFVTIVRTGHLTRASEQLHLTQSAVSKQVRALETELGVSLFDRSSTGMAISAAGRNLLPAAERLLQDAADLLNQALRLRDQVTGVLRLGTIVDPDTLQLGRLLGELLKRHPGIDVKLYHGISGVVRDRLRDGELDAAYFLGESSEPDLVSLPLRMERYVVAAPLGWRHRLVDADWPDLVRLPWVGTPAASSQHALMRRLLGARGLSCRVTVEADQEASMIDLVRGGVALCLIRERLTQPGADTLGIAIWQGPPIDCPLSLLVRRDQQEAPVVRALLDAASWVWRPAMENAGQRP